MGKTQTGKIRSVLLTEAQDDRLENKLLPALAGLGVQNRNQFFRLCAEKMTPSDVRTLLERP